MKTVRLLCLLLSFSSAIAFAAESLQMKSPNSGVINYADKCSNGTNVTDSGRELFINAMLANKDSLLAKAKQDILKQADDSEMNFGITSWVQTGHRRDGCSENDNTYTAFLLKIQRNTSNESTAVAQVDISDNDNGGVRTLTLVSIKTVQKPDAKVCGTLKDNGDSYQILNGQNPYISVADDHPEDPNGVIDQLTRTKRAGDCVCVTGVVTSYDRGGKTAYEFQSLKSLSSCK